MRRPRTVASRWAAVACFTIAVLFVPRLVSAPSPGYAVLSGVLAVAAALSGAKMLAHNCFESHLAATLVATATAGSTLLVLTIGLPGGGTTHVSALHVALLVLSVVVPVLLVLDARMRRESARRTRRPYAL